MSLLALSAQGRANLQTTHRKVVAEVEPGPLEEVHAPPTLRSKDQRLDPMRPEVFDLLVPLVAVLDQTLLEVVVVLVEDEAPLAVADEIISLLILPKKYAR